MNFCHLHLINRRHKEMFWLMDNIITFIFPTVDHFADPTFKVAVILYTVDPFAAGSVWPSLQDVKVDIFLCCWSLCLQAVFAPVSRLSLWSFSVLLIHMSTGSVCLSLQAVGQGSHSLYHWSHCLQAVFAPVYKLSDKVIILCYCWCLCLQVVSDPV